MKKIILFAIAILVTCTSFVSAQNFVLKRAIMFTDTVEDEGIFFAASSDDAEQENDEIDALFDDDLDAGWEGEPEDQNILTTGLRFRNIFIPAGAIIDSAFILFHSHEGKAADDVARITIVGDANSNPPTFTEDSLITDRDQTIASVVWEVAEEWEIYLPYKTPDLAAILQEQIDNPNWAAGNAVAFLLKGENQGPSDVENAREFESFENIADPEDGGDGQHHPERIPMLYVYYSFEQGRIEIPIVFTDTVEDEGIFFAASSDDAEQENDEIDALFDDDLDAGWEGEPEDQNILTTGLRFRNIGIPQGSVIDSAYILFHSHEGKAADDVARITIVGDANINPPTFTEDSLITDRDQTSASVLWEVAEEWEIYLPYKTPDLKAIVQEQISKADWEAGNSIAFVLKGENQGPSEVENAREFESFENIADPEDGGDGQHHPERIPRLIVLYSPMPTSIFNNFEKSYNSLKVYPNPAEQETVMLELPSEKSANISLFTLDGKLVRQQYSTFGKDQEISTEQLPAGIYILRAVQDQTVYSQKLVVK